MYMYIYVCTFMYVYMNENMCVYFTHTHILCVMYVCMSHTHLCVPQESQALLLGLLACLDEFGLV
jgi:hypothetical protein